VNPCLYQLNPRTYLTQIGARDASLDQIPESFLETISSLGFDWLWLLGVWSVSPASRLISQSMPTLLKELKEVLPDLTSSDICGSPFAICRYSVDSALGGDEALARFRKRLAPYGLKLMLDFVPNHVGIDHHWTKSNPEYFIKGNELKLLDDPNNWILLKDGSIFAHGRDPNYPGWTDTLQLNYFNSDLHHAMTCELLKIAERCDGVRCDMAMLLEPEVFSKTWRNYDKSSVPPFWPTAIEQVKKDSPTFVFLAETYWGYEHKLQQHGFDYTYDKTLYDRVIARHGPDVRAHLSAPVKFQRRLTRFLENHDEPRVASKLSSSEHRAAAVLSYLAPGMRFLFDGQLKGKRTRIPVQLSRAPRERTDLSVERIYEELIPIINSLPVKHGAWNLLETKEAWPNNPTHENFVAFLIEHPLKTLLVAVNFASYRGQSFIRIPDRLWLEGSIELRDLLSQERLVRDAQDLKERGLFLDCAEWQTHIFSIEHQ
jgi:hypothetical protein